MISAGIKPSATTYTALISAYGKRGQVEKALDIFNDMIRRGCERNVITYSSLISACEKAGRWEMALELFSKMHKENCKPNVRPWERRRRAPRAHHRALPLHGAPGCTWAAGFARGAHAAA